MSELAYKEPESGNVGGGTRDVDGKGVVGTMED